VKKVLFSVAVCVGFLTVPVMAKDKVTTYQVHFDKGATGTVLKGHVKGYDTVNYIFDTKKGQDIHVSLESKKAYMNIFEPGKSLDDIAVFIGSIKGEKYNDSLVKRGRYTIQVYLMRNEARRGTDAPYTLHIEID